MNSALLHSNFNVQGTTTGRFPSASQPATFIEQLHAAQERFSADLAKVQSKSWAAMAKRCTADGMWHIADAITLHFCQEV